MSDNGTEPDERDRFPIDDLTHPLSTTQLEESIVATRILIHDKAHRARRLNEALKKAQRDYRGTVAAERINAPGPLGGKKDVADDRRSVKLALLQLNAAEVVYDDIVLVMKHLGDDVTAMQSLMKPVIAMYGTETGIGS